MNISCVLYVLYYSGNIVVSLFIKMPNENLHTLLNISSILYENMRGYLSADIIYCERLEGTDHVQ